MQAQRVPHRAGAGPAARVSASAKQSRNPSAQRIHERQAQETRLSWALLAMVGLVIVVMIGVYVAGSVRIADKNRVINELTAKIAAEQSHQQQLEISLSNRQSLDMIRSEAVDRLGMVKPGSWSVKVVSLGSESSGQSMTVYGVGEE